jgi:hypothetical protein
MKGEYSVCPYCFSDVVTNTLLGGSDYPGHSYEEVNKYRCYECGAKGIVKDLLLIEKAKVRHTPQEVMKIIADADNVKEPVLSK